MQFLPARVFRRSGSDFVCRGILIIVEVSSRILSLADFVAAIESLGFKSVKQVLGHLSML